MSIERIACISDCHCGHKGGITPPAWQFSFDRDPYWAKMQRFGWEKMTGWIEELRPVDGYRACLLVGDLIDGRQQINGGQELVAATPEEQSDIAIEYIKQVAPRNGAHAMAFGTPYHTGKLNDDEHKIADAFEIPAELRGDRVIVNIDGCIIDLRHKTGGSQSPVGGDASLRSQQVNCLMWHVMHGFPVPHLLIRAHIHRHQMICDTLPHVCVLPGQQLWTKFGARQCDRPVQFGFAAFDWDTEKQEVVRWTVKTEPLSSTKPQPVKM